MSIVRSWCAGKSLANRWVIFSMEEQRVRRRVGLFSATSFLSSPHARNYPILSPGGLLALNSGFHSHFRPEMIPEEIAVFTGLFQTIANSAGPSVGYQSIDYRLH